MSTARVSTYFDHAATSVPRWPTAIEAAVEAASQVTPGRGMHGMQQVAMAVVERARADVHALCPTGTVCFMSGATHALNQAILGWRPAPRRIALGPMVHNAVRRPALACGSLLWTLPATAQGRVDLERTAGEWPEDVDLVVISHGSNVTGILQPVAALVDLARARGAEVIVDAAQTAGYVVPLDLGDVALVAFSAHKGVAGLPGAGALVVREGVRLEPLIRGGVGHDSSAADVPDEPPARYESGTPNLPGIAAFGAAARACQDGWDFRAASAALVSAVEAAGFAPLSGALPVVSIDPGMAPDVAEDLLDRVFDVVTRSGLHCSPSAHETLGTESSGTLRLSIGRSTTPADLETLTRALIGLREVSSHPGAD